MASASKSSRSNRRPFRHIRQPQRLGRAGAAPNSADLATLLFLRLRLRAAQDRFGRGEQPRPVRLQLIECTGTDQVLKLHPVELPRINPRREFRQVSKWPATARRNNRLHRGHAHFLHRRQRIADGQLAFRHPLNGKVWHQSY